MAWRGNSGSSSKSSSSGSSGRLITKSGIVKVGSDGIARNSDGSRNDTIQAYADYAFGDKSGNDVNRSGMSSTYNTVYGNLTSGKGLNGSYLPVDSAEYQSRYGSSGGGSSAYSRYLDDARQAAINAQNARIQSAIDQVAAQQTGINTTADSAAQQAYIARERALTQAPQQLAAMGQSGGASESALLGINTNYENSRNSIMQNRDAAIRENENQQNQIRSSGNASLADIENQYYNQLAQYQSQQDQYNQQRQDQLADIQSQRDWELRQMAQQNAYALQNSAARNSGSSSGSSGSSGSSTTNFNNLMKLYDATGDTQYLDAASSLMGISNSALSSSPRNAPTVSQAGTYNDTWVQSLIRTYRNMGMTNEQIAQRLNSMGYSY